MRLRTYARIPDHYVHGALACASERLVRICEQRMFPIAPFLFLTSCTSTHVRSPISTFMCLRFKTLESCIASTRVWGARIIVCSPYQNCTY
ncbi:hypothetical protein POVWA2_010400 [Plasmodium ovale wallikeri]|uniref:Uncharacterized protein n=1 Tax=Plasmodium ovale wallikeri TaxID=864142 RepID=A0A1A8YKK4_PLAOA|nr:hypothetical protein POVWA1_010180 [Plasmodium ovale wallikeri]SBT32584.1 hypothetical protein POVWA2_010400 [Plasmodium ovale wallikeri]